MTSLTLSEITPMTLYFEYNMTKLGEVISMKLNLGNLRLCMGPGIMLAILLTCSVTKIHLTIPIF